MGLEVMGHEILGIAHIGYIYTKGEYLNLWEEKNNPTLFKGSK